MVHRLIDIIESADAATRNTSLKSVCGSASADELLKACEALEAYRRHCDNL